MKHKKAEAPSVRGLLDSLGGSFVSARALLQGPGGGLLERAKHGLTLPYRCFTVKLGSRNSGEFGDYVQNPSEWWPPRCPAPPAAPPGAGPAGTAVHWWKTPSGRQGPAGACRPRSAARDRARYPAPLPCAWSSRRWADPGR